MIKKKLLVIERVHEIEQQLKSRYSDSVLRRQYAWWMLEAITYKKKAQLIARETITLSEEEEEKLKRWIDKQINEKIPLQYLLDAIPFNGVEILVKPPVLIPRPETEEWTVNLIKQLQQLRDTYLTILDIGTGSGCIALALAKVVPKATVYATDIADEALALAQENANHNALKNLRFVKSDLFENLPRNIKYDLIVSNPPYVALDEWEKLDESVTLWEDSRALVAQDEGRAVIKKIIDHAPRFLKSNDEMEENEIPQLVIEIGYAHGPAILEYMKSAGFIDVHLHKDLEDKDRIISGRVS